MLTKKQMRKIREHLENAQNPLFYYDNDADGLCSFVILQRFLGRGKGVAIKSFPELDVKYAKKAQELNADYVFILDKPIISRGFVEEITKLQLPIVWIDHHEVQTENFEKQFENFFSFNPIRNRGKNKSSEPVTYLCYKLTERKEDIWLAMMGCIADHFLPDFSEEFKALYPEFWGDVKAPFDAYFGTEIGNIAKAVNFGLKDSVSNVVQLQKFLISCKGPSYVLSEMSTNYSFRKKYQDITKKYNILLKKAKESLKNNLLFFEYSGETSMSADLANELIHIYPGKTIAVIYKKDIIGNVSMRGKSAKKILEKVLKEIEGSGGGHEEAVGARINIRDIPSFKKILEEEVDKKS